MNKKSGQSFAILLEKDVFDPHSITPFWSILWSWLKTIAQEREEAGLGEFRFYLNSSFADESPTLPPAVVEMVERGELAGALGVGQHYSVAHWLMGKNVPFAAYAGFAPLRVGMDLQEYPRLAIAELARQGCKKVAVWAPCVPGAPLSPQHSPEQLAFLRSLFARYELEFDEAMLLPDADMASRFQFAGGTLQAQGYRIAIEAFSNPNRQRPDGVFSMDDLLTNGVLLALSRMHLIPGVDLKMATLSTTGSPSLYGRQSELILIELDPQDVARALFALLDRGLEPDPPEDAEIRLLPTLILPEGNDAAVPQIGLP